MDPSLRVTWSFLIGSCAALPPGLMSGLLPLYFLLVCMRVCPDSSHITNYTKASQEIFHAVEIATKTRKLHRNTELTIRDWSVCLAHIAAA